MTNLPNTRQSLLVRLSNPADEAAWVEFASAYEDVVYRYCCSRGLQDADAREVVQNVFVLVHERVGQWEPSSRKYSFRSWLLRAAHYLCLAALRDRSKPGRSVGGTSSYQRLQDIEDLSSQELVTDLEWRRWAFHWAAGQVQHEVQPTTWKAFWLSAVDELPVEEVAKSLSIRVGAVYTNKCRVLSRIRDRIQSLTRDES